MKGFKTLFFGALVAVFGVLETFDWTNVFSDPQIAGIATTVTGAVIVILRMLTNTPVGKPE